MCPWYQYYAILWLCNVKLCCRSLHCWQKRWGHLLSHTYSWRHSSHLRFLPVTSVLTGTFCAIKVFFSWNIFLLCFLQSRHQIFPILVNNFMLVMSLLIILLKPVLLFLLVNSSCLISYLSILTYFILCPYGPVGLASTFILTKTIKPEYWEEYILGFYFLLKSSSLYMPLSLIFQIFLCTLVF